MEFEAYAILHTRKHEDILKKIDDIDKKSSYGMMKGFMMENGNQEYNII